jgi:DNA polymerase-4/DNA polymerase V
MFEIRKACPECIIVNSDYETYGLISTKMFEIIRRFSPQVEKYSIDEGFIDISGLRRLYHSSYKEIAQKIKTEIELSLSITVSVGLSVNKSLAKLASSYKKPSGLTVVEGRDIGPFLQTIPIEDVWGVGPNTANLLKKHGVKTVFDFAKKSEDYVSKILSKPGIEMWKEMQGEYIWIVNPSPKESYKSISTIRTFSNPSVDRSFIWGQLVLNLEKVCEKARAYKLASKKASLYLKGQDFKMWGMEVKLTRPTAYPLEILPYLKTEFEKLIVPGKQYRATLVVLHDLQTEDETQYSLFDSVPKVDKIKSIFTSLDELSARYGKHIVKSASSLLGNSKKEEAFIRVPNRKQIKQLGFGIRI